ncbi:Maestro heat-like repeat-containing protein family member 7 [Platysternon megacephalum]|uniref:Maestro heat-like repeat-containing protein family member 7 n=1 Tax=Platysternon megacephalum TaxID=55544 RepID=A0A4D9E0G9_9SAUR|nr:Maestro heat-like repeat-containing protein family member 7 [Platysternon megacephalum]
MKKSFLRLLSVLSKSIDWHNMPDFFIHNFASDTAGAIVEMIKKEPRDSLSSTIRLQAMATIIDLSKKHVVKAMGSHQRRILLRTFLKSVFSLPLLTTLQVRGVIRATSAQYTKALFIGTLQTLNEMLQSLILENPVPSELERILQLMDSWMQSREDCLRERAVWSSILLLNFVATEVKLDEASPFTRLGHLVAVLGIRCGDPVKAVSSKAAEGVHHLVSIAWRQKIAQLDRKNVEWTEQRNKEFLAAWSPTVVLNSPSRIAELGRLTPLNAHPDVHGSTPRERTDFILTVMDGLTDHCNNNCQPTAEGLLSAMVNSGGTKVEKAADLVAAVCSRLDSVQQPSSRTLMMKFVGLLAGEAEHLDTVISCLLDYSFPTDSNSAELWQFLSADPALGGQVMENLVVKLQSHHSSEHQASHKSAAAADLVAAVCSRLDSVQQPSSRTLMMKFVGLLAGEAEHLDTVISCLLDYSFPTDSNSAELWQFLSADPALGGQVMENLVVKLQSHHSSEHQASHKSAAATRALYEMISVSKSKDATNRLYPQLLMALLVEIHFSLGQSLPGDKVSGRESSRQSLHTSHAGVLFESSSAVEALKMLLLCVGCRFELTVMEKEQGWILLQSPKDHLHGVSLLARAMLHYACPETTRMLLDLMIPLLDRGDKKHRLTTMAFFVELLRYKEAEKLPHPDTLDRLEEWTKHPSPVFRSLGLRGLGILATQPGKVEQVKALLPAILWGSDEMDDGSILEAISAVHNLLQSLDGSELTSVARKLLPLLSAGRPQVRSAAIMLFTELLNTVKRRQKHLLQEEVTRSLVPLLLHLQDEDPDVGKRCQKALAGCFQLLGWACPKQINSKKAWHDHPQMVDKICQHSVLKLKSVSDILLQCLDHLQSPQAPIRRAAAIFIGCTVQRSEPAMVRQEKELILQCK